VTDAWRSDAFFSASRVWAFSLSQTPQLTTRAPSADDKLFHPIVALLSVALPRSLEFSVVAAFIVNPLDCIFLSHPPPFLALGTSFSRPFPSSCCPFKTFNIFSQGRSPSRRVWETNTLAKLRQILTPCTLVDRFPPGQDLTRRGPGSLEHNPRHLKPTIVFFMFFPKFFVRLVQTSAFIPI